jgi:hypothetical protein
MVKHRMDAWVAGVCGALVAALVLTGCSESPVRPSPQNLPATVPATPAPPAPTHARVFAGATAVSYPLSAYTVDSQFVLYDNATFTLVFQSGHYDGTYGEADGTITFSWKGSGNWAATGSLDGERMTVQYNLAMEMSDFEDAVYTLVK